MSMSVLSKFMQIKFLLQNKENIVIIDPKEDYFAIAGDVNGKKRSLLLWKREENKELPS